jgi:hypothetical protein
VRITVVNADDWQALYVDGEKKAEGHRISIYDLEAAVENFKVLDPPETVLAAQARFGVLFPDSLSDFAQWGNDLLERANVSD